MTDETATASVDELRGCLRALCEKEGIQRPNLLELLTGELAELRRIWNIDLDKGLEAAQNSITGNLYAHIAQLTPRPDRQQLTRGERQRQYMRALKVSFNIDIGKELEGVKLQKRRAWLANSSHGPLKIKERTSERDLDHAINQIAERLASGVETPAVEIPTEEDESPAETIPPPSSKRRKRLVVLSVALVTVVIGVIGLYFFHPFASSKQEPTATPEPISIQNSPIDFIAEQVTAPDLVVPESLSQLERPPAANQAQALKDWETKHHAIYANRMAVSFLVRSGQTAPTEILAARVTVDRREAPMSGTWIAPSGAGPQPVRQLYVDLDATPSKLTKSGGWDFPLRVSESDPEAFLVTARTKTCRCFWTIELDVQLPDGQSRVVTVNDNGKPFELTSSTNTSAKTYLPASDSDPWPTS